MILEKKEAVKLDISAFPKELEGMASEVQGFIEMRSLYHSAIKEVSTKLDILDDEMHVKDDFNPIHHIECRVKSAQSIFDKMQRKGYDVSVKSAAKITDIAGIRVICNYIDDIYKVAEMLKRQDDITLIRERDYIKNPKESGYRSLHLIVLVPVFLSNRTEHVPVEVQLRTIAMDTWASLEHELKYKREGDLPKETEAELVECAERMTDIDMRMQRIHKEL